MGYVFFSSQGKGHGAVVYDSLDFEADAWCVIYSVWYGLGLLIFKLLLVLMFVYPPFLCKGFFVGRGFMS